MWVETSSASAQCFVIFALCKFTQVRLLRWAVSAFNDVANDKKLQDFIASELHQVHLVPQVGIVDGLSQQVTSACLFRACALPGLGNQDHEPAH